MLPLASPRLFGSAAAAVDVIGRARRCCGSAGGGGSPGGEGTGSSRGGWEGCGPGRRCRPGRHDKTKA